MITASFLQAELQTKRFNLAPTWGVHSAESWKYCALVGAMVQSPDDPPNPQRRLGQSPLWGPHFLHFLHKQGGSWPFLSTCPPRQNPSDKRLEPTSQALKWWSQPPFISEIEYVSANALSSICQGLHVVCWPHCTVQLSDQSILSATFCLSEQAAVTYMFLTACT
jgi:hypothetical protein